MAFINTVTDVKAIANGYVMEKGTWSGSGVTTGNITSASATTIYTTNAKISLIEEWGFASDGDNAVIPARDQNDDIIKITFTSGDSGDYYIKGLAT